MLSIASAGGEGSTQEEAAFADRVVTMAPDVATSTNLTGFVNQRGVFEPLEPEESKKDSFRSAGNVFSAAKFDLSGAGQHIELGIAENNLFLMLTAAGMCGPLFGHTLLPVGTLYDPCPYMVITAL